MNRYKSLLRVIIITVLAFSYPVISRASDKQTRDIILSAMKDELNRNINELKMEKLSAPFFIQYNVRDGKFLEVRASLGAIINSQEFPVRNHNVRVMVNGYESNDENFFDFSSMYNQGDRYTNVGMPIENNYEGIRRALWIMTDNVYKRAAEQYERKKAAMKRQSLSPEIAALGDFSKAPAVKSIVNPEEFTYDRLKWEESAKEITSVFKNYPEIHNSELRLFFYNFDQFVVNSEGTEIIKPQTLASIQINAFTQAEDGEELIDHVLHYALKPGELPSKSEIIEEVKQLIGRLLALKKAPVFDATYAGPVLFEDQAAEELFAQRLFRSSNGLLAIRKPFVGDPNALNYVNQVYGESLESRLEKRITSKDITIKALPSLGEYGGTILIGKSETDAEGVKPPEEIMLVENGILKNMLSNRTPTLGAKLSNGHQRELIGPWQSSASLGPGVIKIESSNGLSDKEIKTELLQMAKEEGLDYAIVIRKLKSIVTGKTPATDLMARYMSSQPKKKVMEDPIYVYKVYVKDGREELVRSAELDDPSISALKHISGISKKLSVYNTFMPNAINYYENDMSGVPASFITPGSVLFEELEVRKEKRAYTAKPPVVASPLSKK